MNANDELSHALADLAARADADQPPDRLARIHVRARRAARTRVVAATSAAVLLVGGAGTWIAYNHGTVGSVAPAGQSTATQPAPTATPSSPAPTPGPSTAQATATSQATTSGTLAACLTSSLSLRLGAAQGAAGSRIEPIVFTNSGTTTCTLFGYPGVAFVAPVTGHQVGAAASRSAQHPSTTVTLRPGSSASALLQMVDDLNYPPASCRTVPVSGLRVYPPGDTAAAYVRFSTASTACSTNVSQLTVQSMVAGSTGQ